MLVPRACVCVPGTWHTGTVSVASSGLATVGGTTVDITGVHLGLSPAVISVTLTGGSLGLAVRAYSLPPGACVVVDPGVAIRCSTVAGVGANYTVTVDVDGGHSDPSVDKVSYARPMISSVEGPGAVGAATRGGAQVSLHGVCGGACGGALSSGRALLWSVCVCLAFDVFDYSAVCATACMTVLCVVCVALRCACLSPTSVLWAGTPRWRRGRPLSLTTPLCSWPPTAQ
jgi:hypothetical protein